MSCQSVRKVLSAYVDRRLAPTEAIRVSGHLARCAGCSATTQQLSEIRALLRAMPPVPVPEGLATQLRVAASHERRRLQNRSTWRNLFHNWHERLKLTADNMMRPFALPFAGGLVSALFLFSMLVPTLRVFPGPLNETPTILYTEPIIATTSPFGVGDEILVELIINEEGRVVDYYLPDRKMNRELLGKIGNMILFTSFKPATSFGRPTNGRVTVSFRRSQIMVKG